MAIREYTQDGKKFFEVYVNARGKILNGFESSEVFQASRLYPLLKEKRKD